MLVLTRKKDEQIVIDEQIKITIVEVRGDKVRIGIEAPKEMPVHRAEVQAQIDARIAAENDPDRVTTSDETGGERRVP